MLLFCTSKAISSRCLWSQKPSVDKIAKAEQQSDFHFRGACKKSDTFFDICGGPGVFSLYFLREGASWFVGITLVDDGRDWWYKELLVALQLVSTQYSQNCM